MAREQWESGRSVWDADLGGRDLVVDQVEVREGAAPWECGEGARPGGGRERVDQEPEVRAGRQTGAAVDVVPSRFPRRRLGHHPAGHRAGRHLRALAELGHKPVHFREEIRSRMPLPEEASRLSLPAGTPVMLVCRTAYAEEGRAVEVNEMVLDAAAYVLEYDFDA